MHPDRVLIGLVQPASLLDRLDLRQHRESGEGRGQAIVSGANLNVHGIECDLGYASFVPPAPPAADGVVGSPLRIDKGATPDELVSDPVCD